MDGRGASLATAPNRHNETSSSSQNQRDYTCNNCKTRVKEGYHCNSCEHFYLCVPCYAKSGHPHRVIQVSSNPTRKSVPGNTNKTNLQEERDRIAQRTIWTLMHACRCSDANCAQASCEKMKRVVKHAKACKRQATGGCNTCKQLVALCCKHAKTCRNVNCKVPLCSNIKWQIEEEINEKVHLLMHRLEQKRMAVMDECGYLLKDEYFEPQRLPIPPVVPPLRPPLDFDPFPLPALEPVPPQLDPAPAPASPQPAVAPASPQPAPAPASPPPADPTGHAHVNDGHESPHQPGFRSVHRDSAVTGESVGGKYASTKTEINALLCDNRAVQFARPFDVRRLYCVTDADRTRNERKKRKKKDNDKDIDIIPFLQHSSLPLHSY